MFTSVFNLPRLLLSQKIKCIKFDCKGGRGFSTGDQDSSLISDADEPLFLGRKKITIAVNVSSSDLSQPSSFTKVQQWVGYLEEEVHKIQAPATKAELAVCIKQIYANYFNKFNRMYCGGMCPQFHIHGTQSTLNDIRFFGLEYYEHKDCWRVTCSVPL